MSVVFVDDLAEVLSAGGDSEIEQSTYLPIYLPYLPTQFPSYLPRLPLPRPTDLATVPIPTYLPRAVVLCGGLMTPVFPSRYLERAGDSSRRVVKAYPKFAGLRGVRY